MQLKQILTKMFFQDSNRCIVCEGELNHDTRYGLCEKCSLIRNDSFCLYCGRPIFNQSSYCEDCKNAHFRFTARSSLLYEDKAKDLVRALKYGNKRWLAPYLAEFMADTFYESEWDVDVMTFVPMHRERLKEREYNQAQLLAENLSRIIDMPCIETLSRVRASENLARLDRASREKEIIGEIQRHSDCQSIQHKNILIVDDVITTGTTLNECARILKSLGCKNVFALTFAAARKKPLLY